MVLRAVAAGHAGPDRQLSPSDRRAVPQSHRVDSRRLERPHQLRLDEELQIVFDPARAAELGIQIPRIAQVAGSADDVSGGFVDIGRRQYTMRFAGRYSMDQFADLVLEWRDGRPIRLGDIATIQVKRGDRSDLALQNGNPAIGIQIMKENDANVLETLTAVKAEIFSLRDNELKKMGPVDCAIVRSVSVHRSSHQHGHGQSVQRCRTGGARALVFHS
jgi:multidrug efflux pump subunit AcrB